MSYLDVECPACYASVGMECTNRSTGEYMSRGHEARVIIALDRDGDVGALEPDDPDYAIKPLEDTEPLPIPLLSDNFPDRTVLRWARTYVDKTYIYVAVKASGVGWFLTGKQQDALSWDVLWNKHIIHAHWIEKADHWDDLSRHILS
jgi:hypothetical protein